MINFVIKDFIAYFYFVYSIFFGLEQEIEVKKRLAIYMSASLAFIFSTYFRY